MRRKLFTLAAGVAVAAGAYTAAPSDATTYPTGYGPPMTQPTPASLPHGPEDSILKTLLITVAVVFGAGMALSVLVTAVRRRLDHPARVDARGGRACMRCGYSLIGNVSGVCPECGKPAAR